MTIGIETGLDRDALTNAVAAGNIPCLLAVTYQLTGDDRWLAAPYIPPRTQAFEDLDDGGLPPELQAEVREAAVEAVLAWSRGVPPAVPVPSDEQMTRLMSAVMGEPICADFAPMMAEQLGFEPYVPRDVRARVGSNFSVVVVGAGISGLIAGVQLRRAGIPFVILERNQQLGGTWWENSYPGARVDIPSDLYSFSFFPRNWSESFSRRDEIASYLRDASTHFGLDEFIQYGQSVDSARWDEDDQQWILRITNATGTRELRAAALITAAGLHNTPQIPQFPGVDEFRGPIVHSARWPTDLDLDGKRVAVVGAGASAMQVVTAVADRVQSMVVIQRVPHWIAPNEHYFEPAAQGRHWLFDNLPYYRAWHRFRLYWLYTERTFAALRVDPNAAERGKIVSSFNDAFRRLFTAYARAKLDGRPDLQEQCVPSYPPFGKRLLLDNGWFDTLVRPNVQLVRDGIERLTPTGLVSGDGREHEIDALILCTGFQQQRFLFPMHVEGRNGKDLRSEWGDDDARAYLGITSPGFPNLFHIYGPNSNPPGGSYIVIGEAQVRYVVEMLTTMVEHGLSSVECRPEPFEAYNAELDAANSQMVYAMDGVANYYRNRRGRVVTNAPWPVQSYWASTARPNLDDFVVTAKSNGRRG